MANPPLRGRGALEVMELPLWKRCVFPVGRRPGGRPPGGAHEVASGPASPLDRKPAARDGAGKSVRPHPGTSLRPAIAGAGREAVVTAGTGTASVEMAHLAMP